MPLFYGIPYLYIFKIFQSILVISTCASLFAYPVSGFCQVDTCSMNFTRLIKMGKALMGQNVPYCSVLRQYSTCLNETQRACRGNLKFHGLRSLVQRQQNDFNCSALLVDRSSSSACYDYMREAHGGHRVCSAFGDPHIRTFDGQYYTCSCRGAWPFIDNSYIAIQLTNNQAAPLKHTNINPTYISKLTVIVKSVEGCTEQKLYEASGLLGLPGAFTDGSGYSGHKNDKQVDIVTHKTGTHVEIKLKYIGARIVIRRHQYHLSVIAKIPEQVLQEQSTVDNGQLCLSGCPAHQSIAYKEFLSNAESFSLSLQMSRAEAIAQCGQAGLSDFYFDSCVFDMIVNGEESYKHSASHALNDITRLYPPYKRHVQTNRTTLDIYNHFANLQTSVASNQLVPKLIYIILLLCIMY